MMTRLLWAVVVAGGLVAEAAPSGAPALVDPPVAPPTAAPATPPLAALDARDVELARMKKRMDEMERRLGILSEELEQERVQGSSSVVPPAPQVGQFGLAPAASKVYLVKNGLSIGGYGEITFSAYTPRLQNGTLAPKSAATDLLRGVIYFGYKFTDWLVLNSEVEFEHAGVSDARAGGEAGVEFAYLDFLLAKGINIRAGHVLLPMGFINQIHEPPTFLGALRPAVERGDGILPTTWHENGVGIHGTLPGRVNYQLYLVDGLNAANFGPGGIGGGQQSGHLAVINRPAVTGRVDWLAIPGGFVGGSFYAGDSNQAGGTPPEWTVVFELHAEYRSHGFQARAIYAHSNNSPAGVAALNVADPARTVGVEQYGAYVEAGYDVLSLVETQHSLIPFVRWEMLDTQQRVVPGVVPDLTNRRTVVTLGANYKPIPQVAIKADFNFQLNGAGTGQDQLNAAVAYLF